MENKMKEFKILSHRGAIDSNKFTNFEKRFGVRLPESFKSFLINNDAPWLESNRFKFGNIYSLTHVWPYKIDNGVDSRDLNFLGFNESSYVAEEIFHMQDFDGRAKDHLVAFGIAANGDYICLDYRANPHSDEPSVVLMFHDTFDAEGKMLTCQVADSFEKFMGSLYSNA